MFPAEKDPLFLLAVDNVIAKHPFETLSRLLSVGSMTKLHHPDCHIQFFTVYETRLIQLKSIHIKQT